MRNSPQANGRKSIPARPARKRLAKARVRLAWACVALFFFPQFVFAQSFRLGMVDWNLRAKTELAYDSNVDDVYPEDEDAYRETSDFYWMPELTLRSVPWVTAPRTTYNLDAGIAYQHYLPRDPPHPALYQARR